MSNVKIAAKDTQKLLPSVEKEIDISKHYELSGKFTIRSILVYYLFLIFALIGI